MFGFLTGKKKTAKAKTKDQGKSRAAETAPKNPIRAAETAPKNPIRAAETAPKNPIRAAETAPKNPIRAAETAAGGGTRDQAIQAMKEQMKGVMTPERAALIQNAMAVHKAKQTILSDLSDEQRQKLVALAVKALLNEQPDGNDKK